MAIATLTMLSKTTMMTDDNNEVINKDNNDDDNNDDNNNDNNVDNNDNDNDGDNEDVTLSHCMSATALSVGAWQRPCSDRWGGNGHKMVTKWSQNSHKMVTKWSQRPCSDRWGGNGHKIVTKWSQVVTNGHKMVTKWSQRPCSDRWGGNGQCRATRRGGPVDDRPSPWSICPLASSTYFPNLTLTGCNLLTNCAFLNCL